jgi:hypothetical protein
MKLFAISFRLNAGRTHWPDPSPKDILIQARSRAHSRAHASLGEAVSPTWIPEELQIFHVDFMWRRML